MTPDPQAAPAPPPSLTWVCFAVLAASIGIFIWDRLFAQGALTELLGLYGPFVQRGDWWRPFTTTFVHGSPLHLVFNMLAVGSLGRPLEQKIGSFRFLVCTLCGAMGSAIAVMIWKFEQPTIGASGVILAWAGAMLPILTTTGRRQLYVMLAQVALISLLPQVSGAGHAGGFLFGLPCGGAMRLGPQRFRLLAPVLLFASAVLLVIAGSGRLR